MKTLKLSLANVFARPWSTTLSVILMAFGVGIVGLMLHLDNKLSEQFTRNVKGVDMVVGAKGSPLQLVLCGIYHIDAPTGNISYDELKSLKNNRLVKQIIPLSLGDNYKGYRIVGSTQDIFEHYNASLAEGAFFKKTFEVTLGSKAAALNNLKIGDEIEGAHGLHSESDDHHHAHPYTVTGILAPTNSVADQLIFTSLKSVWDVHAEHNHGAEDEQDHHNHEHEEHVHGPDCNHDHDEEHHHDPQNHEHAEDHSAHVNNNQEVTIGLVKVSGPMAHFSLPRYINQETNMQAALPSIEVNRLFGLLGIGIETLKYLAYIIIFISALSVFISLYQSLKARKNELALLRCLGASRLKIFGSVLFEGLIITLLGWILGLIVSRLALYQLSKSAGSSFHFDLYDGLLLSYDIQILGACIFIGLLASIIPAYDAVKSKIATLLLHN